MLIRVLFFGILKDAAGRSVEVLELPEGASVADVLAYYQGRVPAFKALLSSVAIAVNQEYAAADMKLKSDDEVGLLPPVSGGTAQTPALRPGGSHCLLVRQKIDAQATFEAIKRPEDGAAVLFEGVVRNNTRGRPTLYLEYEAYEEMALRQLEALADQALSDYRVRDVAIIHRLGRLEIGETSVLIVVASAHRGPALEACRWLIDTLKRTVPIWKKEYFEGGAVWADGESFPEQFTHAKGSSRHRPASK